MPSIHLHTPVACGQPLQIRDRCVLGSIRNEPDLLSRDREDKSVARAKESSGLDQLAELQWWRHQLAAFTVPQTQRAIVAATGQHEAVASEGYSKHRSLMPQGSARRQTISCVPKPDDVIFPTRGDHLSVGGKRCAADAVAVPQRRPDGFERGQFVKLGRCRFDRVVTERDQQALSIWAEVACPNVFAFVQPRWNSHEAARRRIPHMHRLSTAARNPSPVAAPVNEWRLVVAIHLRAFRMAIRDAPALQQAVGSGCDDLPAFRTEGTDSNVFGGRASVYDLG